MYKYGDGGVNLPFISYLVTVTETLPLRTEVKSLTDPAQRRVEVRALTLVHDMITVKAESSQAQ